MRRAAPRTGSTATDRGARASLFVFAGRGALVACAVLALAGCASGKKVADFAGTVPVLDPIHFFTGHVRSWGVLEQSGGPVDIVTTDCVGTLEPDGGLHMVQTLDVGGDPSRRDWHMRRTGPGRYEATANDMVGVAQGEAAGRAFHWTWTLATKPGNFLFNVTMDQWWYAYDDGTIVNRTTISKLGFTVAQVTERFAPAGT